MIFTGILLVPTAVPAAVQDLQDLKSVIDSAATTINAAPNNSSWGFLNPASPSGSLGTADLVSNITTSVLRASYLLNIDKTAWLATPNTTTTNTTSPTPTSSDAPTPPFPSATISPNVTLDAPYTDYVNSIPNLSSALTTLGRAWHKELNKPVWEAIDALQQTISTFSSDMLSNELIHGPAMLRSIRASSSLEDAQQAWARVLNLPGATTASARKGRRWVEAEMVETKGGEEGQTKRGEGEDEKERHGRGSATEDFGARVQKGEFYTHKDLWGRAPVAEAALRQRRGEAVE